MPSNLELWQEKELEKGVKIEIPIQKRKFTLPHELTGCGDYVVKTVDEFKQNETPLTKCMCVSTGGLVENRRILLMGEVLPIKVSLMGFIGAVNGSMAVNLACNTLLSRPSELIFAKNLSREQYRKNRSISRFGEYQNKDFWLEDYHSSCGKVGESISAGLCYTAFRGSLASSNMCEIIGGGSNTEKEPTRFCEIYENCIRPAFYIDVWNHTLEFEKREDTWVLKTNLPDEVF